MSSSVNFLSSSSVSFGLEVVISSYSPPLVSILILFLSWSYSTSLPVAAVSLASTSVTLLLPSATISAYSSNAESFASLVSSFLDCVSVLPILIVLSESFVLYLSSIV